MLSRRALLAILASAPGFSVLPAQAQEGGDIALADLATSGGTIKDMAMGDAAAPVKVYEYASMTCPHCARFQADVFPKIKEKYIDKGKVLWTMREFPLDPRATAAFMLARCSGEDKYWAMIDVLFARQAGFTQEQFEKCLQDKALYDGVNAVKQRGNDIFKIDGTPTFFVNGKRF